MQKRIFRGALLLTLATALVIGLLSAAVYYHRSGEQLESQLWQELDMLSTLMEQSADQDAEEAALKGAEYAQPPYVDCAGRHGALR